MDLKFDILSDQSGNAVIKALWKDERRISGDFAIFRPEQVSALILHSIKKSCCEALGLDPVAKMKAIITVPGTLCLRIIDCKV